MTVRDHNPRRLLLEMNKSTNAIKRARQSELQVQTHISSSATQLSNNGSVTSRLEASEGDVQAWLKEIKNTTWR